ncbi:hypothetical protein AHMF7616_01743 [Adhaeribacter pallidiroseus]|uniref:Uncharacterized protein n=1 Tax=Adhaeribacter pallidiroseus TaxID=2072847 RepID=A0A369QFD8_9BACT|nr:hypothetical protein AHMF7616_01743 [Adhaeribacter pallidiroseus]
MAEYEKRVFGLLNRFTNFVSAYKYEALVL